MRVEDGRLKNSRIDFSGHFILKDVTFRVVLSLSVGLYLPKSITSTVISKCGTDTKNIRNIRTRLVKYKYGVKGLDNVHPLLLKVEYF